MKEKKNTDLDVQDVILMDKHTNSIRCLCERFEYVCQYNNNNKYNGSCQAFNSLMCQCEWAVSQ